MYNWNGKKLLILGATQLCIEIVKLAKANGAYVYVVDYYENSPAKKYADESYLLSVTDIDAVVKFINLHKIDAVFTSFTDSILPHYVEICKQTNMPCLLNEEQVKLANNKELFKNTCKKYNVPTIPEFSEYSNLEFPILVKPIDSSGSRGISICNNYNEFELAKKHALTYSKQNKFIVEKFMDCDEITISYTFQDGEIFLTSIHDRYFNQEQKGKTKVPNCYIYPSKYLQRYINEVNDNVINMIKSLGFKNGKIWFQAFVDENGFYIYEPGLRLNGCKIYNVIAEQCGYNELERMLNYAITGTMGNPHLRNCENPKFKKYSATLSYLVKSGKIGKFYGLEKLNSINGAIHWTLWHNEGDTIEEACKGTLLQTILRISLSSPTLSELISSIEQVNNIFKVEDNMGNNMLLTPYNPSNLKTIYAERTPYA